MIKFGVVPREYHEALYNFFIGCLWIKFTPLFPAVHRCVSTLINTVSADQKNMVVNKHASILRGAVWLAQLSPKEEKKELVKRLLACMEQRLHLEKDDHLIQSYQRDTRLDEDCLDINDFLF